MSLYNSDISRKVSLFGFAPSRYAEIDDLPLMSSPGPVFSLIGLYLLFVLKIGPSYMMKRKAFNLSYILLVYNAAQVILSAFMVHRYLNDMLYMGLFPRNCPFTEDKFRKHIILSIWIYFAAKISELLDTVFFVLRKKYSQVTFLHLYHHSIMALGTWTFLKYWPSHSLVFIGVINSFIHVIMYSYYGLSALGPGVAKYLTWKKYMTTAQLIQFILVLIQYTISVQVSDCPPSRANYYFIAGNVAFFFCLFMNFYVQSYRSKSKKKLAASELRFNNEKDYVNGEQKIAFSLNDVDKEKSI